MMYSILMLLPVLPIFFLSFFVGKEDLKDVKYAYLVLSIPGVLFLILSLLEDCGGFTNLGNRYALYFLLPCILVGIVLCKINLKPARSSFVNILLFVIALAQYIPFGLFIGFALYVSCYIYLVSFYILNKERKTIAKE